MPTKEQIEILTKLKEKLSYRLNNIIKKEVEPEKGYIWVGGQNGLIGNRTCHYEFIFYNIEEDPEKDKNTLYLEVHFENDNCKKFKNVISGDENLEFTDWGTNEQYRRIIGTDDNYCVKIEKKTTTDEIVKKAIELLEKLDGTIGNDLAKICDELKPSASLSKRSGKVVDEITYKNRFRQYEQSFYSYHGEIQNALIEKLKNDGNYYGKEIKLDDNKIRVDVLGININGKTYTYDIYEVKPYESPTECIREALGQLLYYKYMFEKNGYTVGKLIVVGKNKLEFYDKEYLKTIKKLKIDYEHQEISK